MRSSGYLKRVAALRVSGPVAVFWERAFAGLPALLIVVVVVPAMFVAYVLPYHDWDALAFGEWSRVIAGQHVFVTQEIRATVIDVQRPLFYVGQGLLWLVFGYHDWIGRWWALLFSVTLLLSLCRLAGVLTARGWTATTARIFAVGIACASGMLATRIADGLTDVPLAAMAALTGVALWSSVRDNVRLPLLALASAATMLTRTTGLLPIAGLALAACLDLRGRGRRIVALEVAALTAGTLAGLAYDSHEASVLHQSLSSFMSSGSSAYYTEQAARVRWDTLAQASWLGAEIRLLVVYGVVYGALRCLTVRRRLTAAVAAPAAFAWSVAGPLAGGGSLGYPFDRSFGVGTLAWLALAAVLVAAPFAPAGPVYPRRVFLGVVLWSLPGAVVWASYRADDLRLLSPAWPGLLLVAAFALTESVIAAGRLVGAAPVAAVAALCALVVLNVPAIDGLGSSRWSDLLSQGPSAWGDSARMEHFALGPIVYELEAVRATAGATGKIISSDGRLRFFFPGHVTNVFPTSCEQTAPFRSFVLLLDQESSALVQAAGGSPDPLAWQQCKRPRLTEVASRPGVFAAFAIGNAPAGQENCAISPTTGSEYDAVFGEGLPYERASALWKRAVAVGFASARVEQTACNTFRVVVHGVPTRSNGIVAEARGAGFLGVRIVPAVDYYAVPGDLTPMR